MTESRNRVVSGLIGLASLALISGACSSSNGGTGTGGTGGSGTGGRAGTSGGGTTGNAGTGGGGATGTGGAGNTDGGALGCQMSDPPPSANILTAATDGGLGLMGGSFSYGGLTATISGGALHIMGNIAATASEQFIGGGIYFNGNTAGTDCIDAHTYTGVKFDIAGSFSGCTMVYSTNDSQHTAIGGTPPDPKASGPAGSYAPQAAIAATAVTSTPAPMMFPFTGAGAPMGGSPAVAVDPTKLESIGWNLDLKAGDAAGCAVDLTITNVMFY